jgi:predicted lactoylglutathione lyase
VAEASRVTFVNLPVENVRTSIAFFRSLGFDFDDKWTDEHAACLVVSEHAYVMLLARPRFAEFVSAPIADPRTGTEAILGVTAETQEEVDALAEKAIGAGGSAAGGTVDDGVMYSRGFRDLDGHMWEVIWINREAIETDPAGVAHAAS